MYIYVRERVCVCVCLFSFVCVCVCVCSGIWVSSSFELWQAHVVLLLLLILLCLAPFSFFHYLLRVFKFPFCIYVCLLLLHSLVSSSSSSSSRPAFLSFFSLFSYPFSMVLLFFPLLNYLYPHLSNLLINREKKNIKKTEKSEFTSLVAQLQWSLASCNKFYYLRVKTLWFFASSGLHCIRICICICICVPIAMYVYVYILVWLIYGWKSEKLKELFFVFPLRAGKCFGSCLCLWFAFVCWPYSMALSNNVSKHSFFFDKQ